MREIYRSISFMILIIFFTTVVLGGSGWGKKEGKNLDNQVATLDGHRLSLSLDLPEKVTVEESFEASATFLYEGKAIIQERILSFTLPEGFVTDDTSPISDANGHYITRVRAPKKPGIYDLDVIVRYPHQHNIRDAAEINVLTKDGFIEDITPEYDKSPYYTGLLAVFPGLFMPGYGYKYAGETHLATNARKNRNSSLHAIAIWATVFGIGSQFLSLSLSTNSLILWNPGIYKYLGNWLHEIFDSSQVVIRKNNVANKLRRE